MAKAPPSAVRVNYTGKQSYQTSYMKKIGLLLFCFVWGLGGCFLFCFCFGFGFCINDMAFSFLSLHPGSCWDLQLACLESFFSLTWIKLSSSFSLNPFFNFFIHKAENLKEDPTSPSHMWRLWEIPSNFWEYPFDTPVSALSPIKKMSLVLQLRCALLLGPVPNAQEPYLLAFPKYPL